jgi:hypothetical protein
MRSLAALSSILFNSNEYLINAMDYAVCERYLTTALMEE